MTRKVLRVGPSTLAVSLPMPWVKRFGIKPGQELDVEEQGSLLRVKTEGAAEEASARLDASALGSIAPKVIGMLYKAGFKRITATYTPNRTVAYKGKAFKEVELVKATFDQLTGMQLWGVGTARGTNSLVAVESSRVNPEEFGNVLNRLNVHVVHQAQQANDYIAGTHANLDEIYLTERLINQAADFCIRILVTFGHTDYKKTLHYYGLINGLESVADKLLQLSLCKDGAEPAGKDVLQVMGQVQEFLEDVASLQRKFDFKKVAALTAAVEAAMQAFSQRPAKPGKKPLLSHTLYATLLDIYELVETLYFLNYDFFREHMPPILGPSAKK